MPFTALSRRQLSRRSFVLSSAALGFGAALPGRAAARHGDVVERRLRPGPARVQLLGPSIPNTPVWAYDGVAPGPELRVRQGDRLRVVVENGLPEETTVHWHGIRLPNAMDGVPHLTQPPIAPGDSFTYEFDLPDAGTFWYHPHQRGFEQVARGLYGALIVEEREPPSVDRDVLWVLSDWRLLRSGEISEDFGNRMETAMSGRIGNVVTVNGRRRDRFAVRSGERIRLRLVNAASARIFALRFGGHDPVVIALDGQPVDPHTPKDGRIVLGPGMRADLILDMSRTPGETIPVRDDFYSGNEYDLIDLAYTQEPPVRQSPPEGWPSLPANPVAQPVVAGVKRHVIRFSGGMMGNVGMMGMMGGHGGIWSVNGVSATGHAMTPALTFRLARSCILRLDNDTAWFHPIHLHGHAFRVIARNDRAVERVETRDTVLIPPKETADIAFVADNPGDWMIHCHVLDHQEGGMMAVFRVA